ncbi:MAG: hypothetical protein CMO16_00300 [Thaumarchaeota archaeon]|nr:hypothetical protein [Nitrososphaerota archaeon]|tara:strand:+ start:1960 stop:2166 length:207 start_codon:yes stop_codon:yes gene_type:complete
MSLGKVHGNKKVWRSFEEARKFTRSLKLRNQTEWNQYYMSNKDGIPKPDDIPSAPWKIYKNDWNGWID